MRLKRALVLEREALLLYRVWVGDLMYRKWRGQSVKIRGDNDFANAGCCQAKQEECPGSVDVAQTDDTPAVVQSVDSLENTRSCQQIPTHGLDTCDGSIAGRKWPKISQLLASDIPRFPGSAPEPVASRRQACRGIHLAQCSTSCCLSPGWANPWLRAYTCYTACNIWLMLGHVHHLHSQNALA